MGAIQIIFKEHPGFVGMCAKSPLLSLAGPLSPSASLSADWSVMSIIYASLNPCVDALPL